MIDLTSNAAAWAEVDALRAAGAALVDALRQWKCASCGGHGRYQPNAANTRDKQRRGVDLSPRFNPPAVTCKVCNGDGLHATARAAIAQAAAAGIGGSP